jgi:hypothetical protein
VIFFALHEREEKRFAASPQNVSIPILLIIHEPFGPREEAAVVLL